MSGRAPVSGPAAAADLLRAYQRQERRFVERRFPLRFEPEVPAVRELYNQAKGLAWNPATDIPWARFDAGRLDAETLAAARLVWSRRAWGAYPGLGESTALLLRFCLESGAVGMDVKLLLSFRPAEEAKHLEACYEMAERLGGYLSDPGAGAVAGATNQAFAQMALDPEVPVEAWVAALGGLDDQLDVNLVVAHLQRATDETARVLLRLIATDKQRHATFAWAWLAHRLPALAPAGRRQVVETVQAMLEQVVLRGYRNSWLLGPEGAALAVAEARVAAAGLGASTAEQEAAVLRATVTQVRERLRAWGLELPPARHDLLGEV